MRHQLTLGTSIIPMLSLSIHLITHLDHNADLVSVTKLSQYWRLLTCHFALDKCQRRHLTTATRCTQFGSNKFGTFIILVLLTSTALQVWLKLPTTPGPYPLIGALAVIYYCMANHTECSTRPAHMALNALDNIPLLQPRLYSLLGLNVTDKSSIYGLLSLVCLRSYSTAFPFATGVLVGLLYQSKYLPLSKLRVPGFLAWFFEVGSAHSNAMLQV
ncbi:hypothetical protein DYB32_000027 [Aphanomyces invadans]|uniref:Peptidase S54 rhomboid domain-containing protein n=1 Tax=Aphanomyces invadans TaxID=157072 RepID=A0A3R6VUM4_9STRA|nr:hypothetical protein DYB32_000027 [Aphanomyces invadans]